MITPAVIVPSAEMIVPVETESLELAAIVSANNPLIVGLVLADYVGLPSELLNVMIPLNVETSFLIPTEMPNSDVTMEISTSTDFQYSCLIKQVL